MHTRGALLHAPGFSKAHDCRNSLEGVEALHYGDSRHIAVCDSRLYSHSAIGVNSLGRAQRPAPTVYAELYIDHFQKIEQATSCRGRPLGPLAVRASPSDMSALIE